MRKTKVLGALAPVFLLLAACSSSDGETQPQKSPVEETPDDKLGEPLTVSLTVPAVPPGEEGTKCLKVRLGNESPVKIGRVHNTLAPSSHHLVVSAVEDPAETTADLFDCPPFKAVLIGAPLTVTQKHDDLIAMPDGVGFPLVEDQLMHLEMHYINTGDETQDITATSELYPLKNDEDVQEASFLIVGNLDISVPANSYKENPESFVPVPDAFDGVTYYAATGHTHRFGTHARLSTAIGADDEGEVIYDPQPYSWQDAALKTYEPGFKIPSGGGFKFTCGWQNPTNTEITYGESALQEMCFFWTYYYPRKEGRRTLIVGVDAMQRRAAEKAAAAGSAP